MITKTTFVEDYKSSKIHKVCYFVSCDQGEVDFCRYEISGGKLMRDLPFETLEKARAGIDKVEAMA